MRRIDARRIESPRSGALLVGRSRGGEGRAVEGSTRVLSRLEEKATFEQSKRSGKDREVAVNGHLEKSVEEREELCLDEPRHNSRIRLGDAWVLSLVQEGLQNNEIHCYLKEKVSKAKEAHTVPPSVVQTNHSPSIPSPTRSKTRSSPSCGHKTAAPLTQPYSFKDSSFQGLEELKLRRYDAVNNRCSKTNAETEKKRVDSAVEP